MGTIMRDDSAFACAPSMRLDVMEQLSEYQFAALNKRLDDIERLMERLEKRLWLTVYGVVATVLTQTVSQFLHPLLYKDFTCIHPSRRNFRMGHSRSA